MMTARTEPVTGEVMPMMQVSFQRYLVPLLALGGLVATACLGSTWYINRLQAGLARTVRSDAAGMEAAVELQVQLRHLRVHSLVFTDDPTEERRAVALADIARIDAALENVRATAKDPEDAALAVRIVEDYTNYLDNLHLNQPLSQTQRNPGDLARWSDGHHMSALLVPCRELADRQRDRMNNSLMRSETQTIWAGGILLGLGMIGVLAGILSGFVTARGLTRRVAQLLVRVQAVQAHLDQEVGAMTVNHSYDLSDLDEQLIRVVGRVQEVCQRLQEQERDLLRAEQLAAVGQLAAGVAHEVRNPLTGIKLLLQAATRETKPTPLTLERLHLLLHEVARIERTVQGLIDFSRTRPVERVRQDLKGIVEIAVGLAQSHSDVKGVTLDTDLAPETLPAIVDRDQFLSLLTNLLRNAIEATAPGGQVGVVTRVEPSGMIQLKVWDTGTGIAPNIADRLFMPFTTTKLTGTGLGLNLAHRIAQDHGGSLTAVGRPEGGTCFTLVIPAAEPVDAEAVNR